MSSKWPRKRLGDYCEKIGSGATPKGGKDAYLDHGEIYLIRSQNIYNDGFKDSGLVFISEDQAKKLDNVSVKPNDILLNITGDSVARVCQAPVEYIPARVNQHVAIIRPNPKEFDASFLRYFLASPQHQELMLGLASAGATRNALTKQMIESFEVPCPEMRLQKSISSILDALSDRITLLIQTNKTLENISQAIFKSWFIDFDPVRANAEDRVYEGIPKQYTNIFPNGFIKQGRQDIPIGWDVVSIYEIATVTYGAPFSSKLFTSQPVGKPLVRIRDLKDEKSNVYTEEVHPKGYLLKAGDIVVGMDGEFRAYVWGGDEAWLNQRVCVFHPTDKSCSTFLRFSLVPLLAAVEASETATTVIHLGKNDIDRFKIVLPPKKIMDAFSEIVNPMFEMLVKNKRQIQTLSNLRDTLLPKLMSGQINVEEMNDLMAA
jgi:type I restriction enzyme S subunit